MSQTVRRGPSATQARSRARRLALQALYQWDLSGGEPGGILGQFREREEEMRGADADYFEQLVRGIIDDVAALDALLAPRTTRPLGDVDPVERSILRLGAWELLRRPEVPYRVALDEAVNLARRFGAEESFGFINGVLDGLSKELRAVERGQ